MATCDRKRLIDLIMEHEPRFSFFDKYAEMHYDYWRWEKYYEELEAERMHSLSYLGYYDE